MLRALTTIRPLVRTRVPRLAPASASAALRSFSTTSRALAGKEEHHESGPPAPQLYGPDATPLDTIPTDEAQATGLERFQLLGKMEGIDVFDMRPLDSSRLGTMADPIKVPTLFPERIIGCSGSPADSHEVVYIGANTSKPRHRCPECGSVYTLELQGEEDGPVIHTN